MKDSKGRKISKKKFAFFVIICILAIAAMVGLAILLVNIFERIAERIGFILISPTITGALMFALVVGILWFILGMIFSKNKINSLKDMARNIYDMLKLFGTQVGGMVADFLLILFACMNFNKIVNMTGVPPDMMMGTLSLGIFALSVRGIFRALQIGNMDYYIRKFLNTNEDIKYE